MACVTWMRALSTRRFLSIHSTTISSSSATNHFELVRYKRIGPLGKFRRGPFRVASPGDDEDADGYSDGDW